MNDLKQKKYKYPFLNPGLSAEERTKDLISRLKPEEKLGFLSTRQASVPRLGINEFRVGCEVARGYVGREKAEYSTVFPQPIGLASTFDSDLLHNLGEIAGNEARIYSGKFPGTRLMLWGPTVDLCRHPLWGRNEEGYGEDPTLTGELSTSYTLGMRGNDKKYLRVVPTLKHFCANNHEEDRGSDSANLAPRMRYEYYYAAFEASVRAKGALSMMTAYNELSGVPGINNPDLQKICKDKWGLSFCVTDGGDFVQSVLSHKFSSSHAETLALAVKAGNDIMTDNADTVMAAGKEALRLGLLTEADLDKSIKNVISCRIRLGEFDEKHPYINIPETLLDCEEYRAVNHRAAKEAVTLLKNDSALPLAKNKIEKIAVIGPLADGEFPDWYTGYSSYNISVLDGLRSYLGSDKVVYDDGYDHVAIKSELNSKYLKADSAEDGAAVYAKGNKPGGKSLYKKLEWDDEVLFMSLKSGKMLRDNGDYLADADNVFEWFVRETFRPAQYPDNKTVYKSWNKRDVMVNEELKLVSADSGAKDNSRLFTEELVSDGAERALKIARESDAVILCVGNNPMMGARECHDRTTLSLNPHQKKLISAVKKSGKPVILLIVSSYPFSVVKEQNDAKIPAVIYTAHGGPEMGSVIAKTLFGEYNPAGRTPQTWYKSELDLPSLKEYDIQDGGLTYLYFKGEPLYPFGYGLSYSEFKYSDFSAEEKGNKIIFNLTVKNTSGRDGEEVPQIYYGIRKSRVVRAEKTLCAFKRVFIKAGESVGLSFVIPKDRLRFYDVTRDKFVVEEGIYDFYASASSKDERLAAKLAVSGETVPPRNLFRGASAMNFDRKKQIKYNWSKEHEEHYISTNGWNSEISFDMTECTGANGAEIFASVNMGIGKAEIILDGEETPFAAVEIPATSEPYVFRKHKISFPETLEGVHNITLRLSSGINLMTFGLKR